MAQQIFEPEHVARGIVTLYPELAREIATSLLNDAIMIGESGRARLWWDVLVRIGRMQDQGSLRIH